MQSMIKAAIRSFIIRNYFFGDETPHFDDNHSFLEKGIVDSTGILELISYIEDVYDLSIEDDEMIPENLDSLDNIAAFVVRKKNNESVALT